MKQTLVLLCLFLAAAGVWLGVMENVLKHAGYAGRSAIAACITLQAILTLLSLWLNGRPPVFRALVLLGALAIALFGASATINILRSRHFEAFVLLIGAALVLEGALTIAVLLRMSKAGTT